MVRAQPHQQPAKRRLCQAILSSWYGRGEGPQDARQYWEGKGGNPRPWARAGLETTEPWVSQQVSRRKKKFLEADKAASENKRFYLVGNRTKHREICFVWVDKISSRQLNSGQKNTTAFPHN